MQSAKKHLLFLIEKRQKQSSAAAQGDIIDGFSSSLLKMARMTDIPSGSVKTR
jgi:hypothetical protein